MKTSSIKAVFYWITTGFLCFELVYGASWDFNILNKEYVYEVFRHLGYPMYLGAILGVCKLIATVVILIPGFTLAKEWAYTGVAIIFLGAFASHLIVGDTSDKFVWSLAFGVLTITSWALRPASRRIMAKPLTN